MKNEIISIRQEVVICISPLNKWPHKIDMIQQNNWRLISTQLEQ